VIESSTNLTIQKLDTYVDDVREALDMMSERLVVGNEAGTASPGVKMGEGRWDDRQIACTLIDQKQ
jgi:hypothetical protein